MELHRPKEDKIPYVCELNFTAAGGQHGDIIQVFVFSASTTFLCHCVQLVCGYGLHSRLSILSHLVLLFYLFAYYV